MEIVSTWTSSELSSINLKSINKSEELNCVSADSGPGREVELCNRNSFAASIENNKNDSDLGGDCNVGRSEGCLHN